MKAEEKYSSNRRTFHGLLIKPHKQVGFAFLYLCLGILALSGSMYYMLDVLQTNFMAIVPKANLTEDAIQALREQFEIARGVLIVLTAVIISATLYGGLEVSHRVFGPMVPFFRHVRELVAGNYKTRVRLRKKDEFHDFKDILNELAEALEKKNEPHARN